MDDLRLKIADKRQKMELHDWIDKCPDGIKGLILVQFDDAEDDSMLRIRYKEIGSITISDLLYLVKTYEHQIIKHAVGE